MAKFWRLKMLKRFRFGGQDSITNPNPNIIRLTKNHESESEYSGFGGKDSNPNPNIRYNTVLLPTVLQPSPYIELVRESKSRGFFL